VTGAESRVPCPRLRGHAGKSAETRTCPRKRGHGTHDLARSATENYFASFASISSRESVRSRRRR
jgi:hypothetical protein